MIALISIIAAVVLIALVVHGIRVLRYARSDDWQIDQRLTRYASR